MVDLTGERAKGSLLGFLWLASRGCAQTISRCCFVLVAEDKATQT